MAGEPQRAEDSHEVLSRDTEVRPRELPIRDLLLPHQAVTVCEARYSSARFEFFPPTIPLSDTIPIYVVVRQPKSSIRTVTALGGPADTPRPPKAAPGSATRTA
ncbi:hypothetical protein RHS04_01106 [Rhizoctonia solani]|uniref:Uncharacterized protein n=1 Tax=Rhizoctonia solani TaxID=456999 RepID=A0A8H7HDP8_9AGAM|nr:hypothetical protein RHS04_01106 [Rhizoctonia solani]